MNETTLMYTFAQVYSVDIIELLIDGKHQSEVVMKKIECIIRPERLEKLKECFVKEGVEGMTISDVRGFGSQRTRPENYLVLPKVKVEVYCQDERLEEIVDLILTVCSRKQMGDGKIVILDVQDIIKVRTGERNSQLVV